MYNLELISLRRFLKFLCFLKQFNKCVFFFVICCLSFYSTLLIQLKMKNKNE